MDDFLASKSKAAIIASLPEAEREAFYASLSKNEAEALQYEWGFWRRPKQCLPTGKWKWWVILAGRGFGKTRTGAETIRDWVTAGFNHLGLIGQTAADVRMTMIEGESGLLNVFPPSQKPLYIASKRKIEFHTGAYAYIYSGDEPDQLRGPQHMKVWVDELVKFKYPTECFDNIEMGLRLGKSPQGVITTTPKPQRILRQLVDDTNNFVTRGSTYENADNLAESFLERIKKKYEGTRVGQQEIHAVLLNDIKGALWSTQMIELARVRTAPELVRVVVAIDPAINSDSEADMTGICCAGIDEKGDVYILADETVKATPQVWAQKAVETYKYWNADRIIGEANNGGDMIETIIRMVDSAIPYKKVHATRGKATRAEPISAMYEQNKVHHVGYLEELEAEMTEWVPGTTVRSPNRIDALVWACTELALDMDGFGDIIPIERFIWR